MAKMTKNAPIGIFDSGLGGLTVVKAVMRQLPSEDIVYLGDTARVPYGTKSPESIIRFSKQNVSALLKHKVKMVIIACNSSSSHAIPALRKQFDVPIIGVLGPGVKKAASVTRNKKVGIIATPATILSGAYAKQIRKTKPGVKVYSQACPLFVPLVEEGWFDRKVTREIAAEYLSGLKKAGIDTLILGCTHYPLLKKMLRKVMGPKVVLVDSAREVAGEAKKRLEALGLDRTRPRRASRRFFISDESKHFGRLAQRFLGTPIRNVRRYNFE